MGVSALQQDDPAHRLEPRHIPLSLYIHLPWCVRKCPYCDFNSHQVRGDLPEQAYVEALLEDLRQEAARAGGRPVQTVFLGGGTPSLFSGNAIERILTGMRRSLLLEARAEITLEANPGAVDAGYFQAYRWAGVNRISIGAQSFNEAHLQALGRIHNPGEALQAFRRARQAGFDNINLDLMFGLPGQQLHEALADLRRAVALEPEHISWYQLTIEPNTRFHHQPPATPDDDLLWRMQEAGQALLADAGYAQYEVSAYARPGRACRHNLNYWQFGDYLALGAGAHGKFSTSGGVVRYSKQRHPERYQQTPRGEERLLDDDDLQLEFMMNALRLNRGVAAEQFVRRTGLPLATLEPALAEARNRGLLEDDPAVLCPTPLGRAFLNDLLGCFSP